MENSSVHCYRIFYVARNGWEYAKNIRAKSRNEAFAKAEKAGIDDIVGYEKHDRCLRCMLSKLFHRHRMAT